MYCALIKVEFGMETLTGNETKDLASLAQRMRRKFKVAVQTQASQSGKGFTGLVVVALAHRDQELRRLMEEVVEECEASGFGRVTEEQGMIDHIDRFLEE